MRLLQQTTQIYHQCPAIRQRLHQSGHFELEPLSINKKVRRDDEEKDRIVIIAHTHTHRFLSIYEHLRWFYSYLWMLCTIDEIQDVENSRIRELGNFRIDII